MERDIFLAALEKPTAEARAEYLQLACAGNTTLLQQVEELLRLHGKTDGFLQTPLAERLADGVAALDDAAETGCDPPTSPKGNRWHGFLSPSKQPGSLGKLGHYEVQEVIGSGGMGIVLGAFDERLHRMVAIKVMAPPLATSVAARKRFLREARAAAAVSHDHIVTIHAVEESGDLPYLVMQYVAGMSLQQRIDRDGPMAVHEILRIGMQAAAALAAAHAQGLIHRDIKPANILLENGVERVKITDFGLARAAADASISQSGIIAGTPQYMAPEQARGEALDSRTDLFSLGSVLYAMCTGRAPFRAVSSVAVLKRVCDESPSPIQEANADIPDWLVALIDKLQAKQPQDRYQSAAEVAELMGQRLAQLQNSTVFPSPVHVASGGRQPSHSAARPKRRWAIAAASLLCLVATFAIAEGTGVTQVAATVIRLMTPDGTLVVEIDDPAVKVTVEGDGGLVITGAGLEEIRLRPGSYRVQADKDGQPLPLDKDLVNVSRGGREIVKVKLESSTAIAPAKVEKDAFVLLGGQGVAERKFDTLAEAVLSSTGNDVIEIRGNGPFVSVPIEFRHPLTIRAGKGFWPVITDSPQSPELDMYSFLWAKGSLRLEGLEIHCTPKRPLHLLVADAPLLVANCRFILRRLMCHCISSSADCVMRNCEVLGPGGAALAIERSDTRTVVANCLLVGHTNLSDTDPAGSSTIRFTGNTFVTAQFGSSLLHIMYMPRAQATLAPSGRLSVFTSDSVFVFDSNRFVYELFQPETFNPHFTADEAEKWLTSHVEWREQRNLYSLSNSLLGISNQESGEVFQDLEARRGTNLADWDDFWGLTDTESSVGVIRFHGGDLRAKACEDVGKVTPADFRLRPDSAGYRAGKDGKDLGADVDLVGPGPAYERWKKTVEYQEWLKETGQKK